MTWVQIILTLVIGAGAGVGVLALFDSFRLTHPPGYVHPRSESFAYASTPISVHGLAYEDVEFPTTEGAAIRGWLIPSSARDRRVVILGVHGRAGDRLGLLPHAATFHGEGASAVLIDLRENGLSDGKGRGILLGVREAEDVATVSRALKKLGYRRVIVYGCSLGAMAAILAAAQEQEIDGVIAESALESFPAYMTDVMRRRLERSAIQVPYLARMWGPFVVELTRVRLGLPQLVHPIDAVSSIAPRPLLLVHGTADEAVPIDHARRIVARTNGHALLITLQGAGHCDALAAPEIRRAFVASFVKTVAATSGGADQ